MLHIFLKYITLGIAYDIKTTAHLKCHLCF